MPLPLPEMAKSETLLMRTIRQFHEKFATRLMSMSASTLRATAWQLDAYFEENKKYKDAEFIKQLLAILEFGVQKKSASDWTLERAKKDLRGRTRGVNQYANQQKPLPEIKPPKEPVTIGGRAVRPVVPKNLLPIRRDLV